MRARKLDKKTNIFVQRFAEGRVKMTNNEMLCVSRQIQSCSFSFSDIFLAKLQFYKQVLEISWPQKVKVRSN